MTLSSVIALILRFFT